MKEMTLPAQTGTLVAISSVFPRNIDLMSFGEFQHQISVLVDLFVCFLVIPT